jgi:hypothetical protein
MWSGVAAWTGGSSCVAGCLYIVYLRHHPPVTGHRMASLPTRRLVWDCFKTEVVTQDGSKTGLGDGRLVSYPLPMLLLLDMVVEGGSYFWMPASRSMDNTSCRGGRAGDPVTGSEGGAGRLRNQMTGCLPNLQCLPACPRAVGVVNAGAEQLQPHQQQGVEVEGPAVPC